MKLFGKRNKKKSDTPVNPQEVTESVIDKYFFSDYSENSENNASGNTDSCPVTANIAVDAAEIPFQKTERTVKTDNLSDNASLLGMYSVIGRRDSQQDALAVSDSSPKTSFKNEKLLAVLCDGMGGMNGGEKASALCIEQILDLYSKNTLPYPEFYRNAITYIDGQVASLKDDSGNFLGGGSTMVSVIIDDDNLYWGSVGDSHIYIVRNNDMVMVNTEHNYMLELLDMVKNGKITLEEAQADKDKDALISYMGMGAVTLMDVIEKPLKLQDGDYIILCSDGLYRSASDSEIFSIVTSGIADMQNVAERLVECAMSKNNPYQDNTSVIVIKYQ